MGPIAVKGDVTRQERGHDYVEAPAFCAHCFRSIGMLRVEFDTLFGIDEDERVLNGRARVY